MARPSRTRMVCQASQGQASAQFAAAAMAAAVLISATPVHAGVVVQQPTLKKLFQSDGEPAQVKERAFRVPGAKSDAPPVAAAEAPKPKTSEPIGEFGVDPRVIALPASIAGIVALGFAASKIDGGFVEWITESGAVVRNSDNWAGFEEELKPDNYFWNPTPGATGKKGTTKVNKGTKSTKR